MCTAGVQVCTAGVQVCTVQVYRCVLRVYRCVLCVYRCVAVISVLLYLFSVHRCCIVQVHFITHGGYCQKLCIRSLILLYDFSSDNAVQ